MIIEEIELVNYRSYTYSRVTFDRKINVIIGKNGSGKTNIAEAIHYISLGRSFRTSDDARLIKKGQKEARIKAVVSGLGLKKTIEIVLTPQGKKVLINTKPILRLSELSNVANVLVFEPRDVLMFDDAPRVRRQFLDMTLSKLHPAYLRHITLYEKILKERNNLLKQMQVDRQHLAILTEQLIEASFPLIEARQAYLNQINNVLSKVVGLIKGEKFNVSLRYVPYLLLQNDYPLQARLLYEKTLEQDIKRKTTTVGIHREDFVVVYEEEAIASFGSQGENRIVALALKVSPYFLIEEKESKPIIVLDDVLSELDDSTQQRLLLFLEKVEQVFITTTHYPIGRHTQYDIQNQIMTRRPHHGK